MAEIIVIKKGEKNALTIVDPQIDFIMPDGSLFVAGIPNEANSLEVLRRIRDLTEAPFDHLTCTEDAHPRKKHIEYNIFGGKHCVVGTDGQKYIGVLQQAYYKADERLVKGMNPYLISYSIVVSPGYPKHIKSLRLKGIRKVFVTGWAYTHCVGESAIAYAAQGFETYVVRDATRSVPPPYGDPEAMDKKLALYGVKLINFDQLYVG